MEKYFFYKVWLDHGVADELIATFVDEKILNKCKPSLNRYAKSLDCKLKIEEFYQTSNGVQAWCEETNLFRPTQRPKLRPTKR